MSQFGTAFGRMTSKARGLFAAAAIGGALFAAAPASATITLISATMDQTNTAYITGPLYPTGVNVYIAPVTFLATDSASPGTFSFMAFCVDIYHDMYINTTLNYEYHEESLLTDSALSTASGQAGNALTNTEKKKISALLNYADFLVATAPADITIKLAGIQGAIWKVANETHGYTIDAANSDVDTLIATYSADAALMPYMPVGNKSRAIFEDDYGHQAFGFGGGVPEPATWLMMIMGFGGIGAVLRRRRAAVAFA
ncbi:MAG: hypothetical protein JWQ29_2263 [Phenylobacterium sp.]|nr:hypothetical protein [Phenylobacterium sp.]